jgi:hypothetical protein
MSGTGRDLSPPTVTRVLLAPTVTKILLATYGAVGALVAFRQPRVLALTIAGASVVVVVALALISPPVGRYALLVVAVLAPVVALAWVVSIEADDAFAVSLALGAISVPSLLLRLRLVEPTLRVCPSQVELEQTVGDLTADGYTLTSRSKNLAWLEKGERGSVGIHLVLLWFTFGLGNVIYATAKQRHRDSVMIRVDQTQPDPSPAGR